MDEKLTQIESLLALFEARDQTYEYMTWAILETMENTLLSAICELFQVNRKQVEWRHLSIVESTLQIVCAAQYEQVENMPDFVKKIPEANIKDTETQSYECALRVGIPLHMVYESKDKVLSFLSEMIGSATHSVTDVQSISSPIPEDNQFNVSSLTDDQILQIINLHQYTQGKH